MIPIRTPDMTHTLFGEEGSDIEPLPALVEGDYRTTTIWGLNEDERAQVAEGARIGLIVLMHPTPPVALTVAFPHCEECGRRMDWEPRLKTFVCAHGVVDEDGLG